MSEKRLDVNDSFVIETPEGERVTFTVVGLLEDEEEGTPYAVLFHESSGEEDEEMFVVTDAYGTLIDDDELAQEVLDDYFEYAEREEEGDE